MVSFDTFAKDFIRLNINENAEKLQLKKASGQIKNYKDLIEQIKLRQKIKEKLPNWYQNFALVIPKSVSTEQSSSEITAQYKASITNGQLLIDLTGGMGVDYAAMSQQFGRAIYIDQNTELTEIAKHNFHQLGFNNCEFIADDCIKFIENFSEKIDWLYVDPARRDSAGEKVFSLAECSPNLLIYKQLLLSKADNILVKCSPMLDIDLAKKQLEKVYRTYIICIENEVKELLFHLKKVTDDSNSIKIIYIKNERIEEFEFDSKNEKNLAFEIGPIEKYLYEPNAGIMKAAAFKTISKKFNCKKLNANTHLYTSDQLIVDFPGRSFEIIGQVKPNKKDLKLILPDLKANLKVRNFPETTEKLKKALGIKDGGNDYLFACTDNFNKKIILHTIKIN
jgi:16S rRNA G966 N2-methylase RsmD